MNICGLQLPINDGYLKIVSSTTQSKGKMEAVIKRNIIYLRLDVCDTPYHGSALILSADRH